jgi:hypothetical protein
MNIKLLKKVDSLKNINRLTNSKFVQIKIRNWFTNIFFLQFLILVLPPLYWLTNLETILYTINYQIYFK